MDYEHWCSLSDEELARYDVAYLNLLAAEGLPGSESLDISAALVKINHWTNVAHRNTVHWRKTFVPSDDCQTDAQHCMMSLVTVLQRDLGVHYNVNCMDGPYNALDSRNNFLHGPLSDHGGTCCSLPILYLAIGRRLGYPLKLVSTIGHSFVRWDDPSGERFNIECAGVGFAARDDENYRLWPRAFTDAERESQIYMQNLTPRQEMAQNFVERAHCLADNLQFFEAVKAFHFAHKLNPCYEYFWALTSKMEKIVERTRYFSHSIYSCSRSQVDFAASMCADPRQAKLDEAARLDLHRIIGLHEDRERQSQELSLKSGGLNYLNIRQTPFSLVKDTNHVCPQHRSIYQ